MRRSPPSIVCTRAKFNFASRKRFERQEARPEGQREKTMQIENCKLKSANLIGNGHCAVKLPNNLQFAICNFQFSISFLFALPRTRKSSPTKPSPVLPTARARLPI